MHYLEIRERVRKMRRNPTLSEKALWQNLKGKKLFGFRFLRQHLIVYQVTGQIITQVRTKGSADPK